MKEPNKRLPPLNTVIAFEAAARLLSFTKAAEELHLSQAAVSRQIQGLEERLGTPLFQRRHKEIKLTRAGVIFQSTITQCLSMIRRTVMDIEALETQSVTIAASLGMSSFWLLPAILKFREEHPDVNIRVMANDEFVDPRREVIDFAIRYGEGQWPGLVSEKLFQEEVFPVCSPGYLASRDLTTIRDFSKEQLIEIDRPISHFGTWESWLRRATGSEEPLNISLRLSNYDMVYRAICEGRGVALAWPYAIPEEARDTLLVKASPHRISTGYSEYVVYPFGQRLSSAANLVLEWLLEHAKRSVWADPK